MVSKRLNRIILSSLFIFLLTGVLFSGNDQDKIKDVLSNLEKGWKNKDINLLKTCFIKVPSQQVSMYEYLFSISDHIVLDIDIKDITINGAFANVKARLKKEITYSPSGSLSNKEIRDKELRYILGKKNGNWYILGTVDESLSKAFNNNGSVQVTDKNYKAINKMMEQLSLEDRKKMYSSFNVNTAKIISKENNEIRWAPMGVLLRYKATITTEKLNNKGEGGGDVIWESALTFNLYMKIDKDIIKKLDKGKIYYLNIYGFNSQNAVMGIGIKQIKRE